jgi:hypothetical protein
LNFNLNTFGQEELIKEKGLVIFSLKDKNLWQKDKSILYIIYK